MSTTFSKGGATTTLGGASATGGTSASTTRSTRGATTIGGASEAGGAPATGGTTSAGSQQGTGGTASTGGIPATGGASAGGKATGGDATSGGSTATGGTATKGGTAAGGTATGGSSGTGGAPPACVTNQISVCSGTNPIKCDFDGNVGDYEVTVDLGGSAAGDMYVEAESYRRMLGEVKTAAGETKRFSFGVNVRSPEGEPLSTTTGSPGLQVYIRGTTPKLSAICAKALSPAPKVWVAGDSTVCDQGGTDYAGWGQHLAQFFTVPVSVANYADSGESSTTVLFALGSDKTHTNPDGANVIAEFVRDAVKDQKLGLATYIRP